MKRITPKRIAPPASAYSHAFLIESPRQFLTVSGQLGERPDGTCETGALAQASRAWANIATILDEAGMTLDDIVKVTSYIVGPDNIRAYVDAHNAALGLREPPWTLICVAALGRPEYLIEVDVLAARE